MTTTINNAYTATFGVNYEELCYLLNTVKIAHYAASTLYSDNSKMLNRLEHRLNMAKSEMDDRLLGHDDPQDITE